MVRGDFGMGILFGMIFFVLEIWELDEYRFVWKMRGIVFFIFDVE